MSTSVASTVNAIGSRQTIRRIILLALVRLEWKTERSPTKKPEMPDQTIRNVKKNVKLARRSVVRVGSGLDRSLNTSLTKDNGNRDQSSTKQIRRMSDILVMPFLCLAKNSPTRGKGGGLLRLAK